MNALLVDDHALMMEGMKHFLTSNGIKVVGTACSGAEALLQYEMHQMEIDIVLMDIQMKDCDGIEATSMIKKEYPQAKIVMLTAFEDEDNLLAAVQAGAEGYLLKDMEPESFLQQLSRLAAGEMPLAPRLAERLLYKFSHYQEAFREDSNAYEKEKSADEPITEKPARELSERQREVLQLLTQGMTYRQIGDRLELKEVTVKYHVREILNKLHLPNRVTLIAYTLREGMVDEGSLPS
ncbi:MAG: response regulator transcription factor [Sporomusaceae bacterium]|nr:response regulator transcription factor [Sporomusaceae bacterium]